MYYNRTANSEYFISATEDKKVYLNAKEIQKRNFVGVEIEIFEFLSFATSLEQIANITEEKLYSFQRRLKAMGVFKAKEPFTNSPKPMFFINSFIGVS